MTDLIPEWVIEAHGYAHPKKARSDCRGTKMSRAYEAGYNDARADALHELTLAMRDIAVSDHLDKMERALALLDEARGFAAMSPQGRDNIVEVWEMLPDLVEQAYRTGFEDGEKHNAENQDYQRGAEADFHSHVQQLHNSRKWGE